jgi:hypothetical protein
MALIKHILTDYLIFLVVGLSFIIVGIVIPAFKLYWLIAGLNGRPKSELKKYNLRYIEKYVGRFILVMGILIILNPIAWTLLSKEENIEQTFLIIILSTVSLMFAFGRINRRKIYNS